MVAVVARHAGKSELFSAGKRAHPTNELEATSERILGAMSIVAVTFVGTLNRQFE